MHKKFVMKYWSIIAPVMVGLVIVSVIAAVEYRAHRGAAMRPSGPAKQAAGASPAEEPKSNAEKEPLAFEFPAEGPVKTFHMDQDREAIITMHWSGKAQTWAHIEHYTSIVYPGEPAVIELEEPEPGLYPLTLDTGEIRGYIKVD